MSQTQPPETLWFGMNVGEWPVQAFVDERHAMHWLGEGDARRRVWKARVRELEEMRLVKPEPYLEPVVKEDPS